MSMTTAYVLEEIQAERDRQDARWGEQNYEIISDLGQRDFAREVDTIRAECDAAAKAGKLTWRHIAEEEYFEVFAETDPVKRRMELVQLAAVVVAAIESEDRKAAAAKKPAHPTRSAPPNCNLHDDCDSAENIAAGRGIIPRYGPGSSRLQHCFDEGCEDCFGA